MDFKHVYYYACCLFRYLNFLFALTKEHGATCCQHCVKLGDECDHFSCQDLCVPLEEVQIWYFPQRVCQMTALNIQIDMRQGSTWDWAA